MHALSRRALLASFAALTVSSVRSNAQGHPIKIIYPYSAGGSADTIVRLFAEHLQTSLGRPAFVDNRLGAGGRIGARAVKDAAPDGATLLFAAAAQMTLQPHIYSDLGYDPFLEFAPISQTVKSDLAFAVSSQVPPGSTKELIVWFKQNPASALYGSPGAGTSAHFAGIEFARLSGLDMRHVAYRGTSAALPDLLAGRVPLYIAAIAELLEHHKRGGIRILATTDTARSELLPDIPTLRESGIEIEVPGWFGFYAPANTPNEVLSRLEKEIVAATHSPGIHGKIVAIGFQPTGTTAKELKEIQRIQFERWGVIVKSSGFNPNE